jgi:hypothetical protein
MQQTLAQAKSSARRNGAAQRAKAEKVASDNILSRMVASLRPALNQDSAKNRFSALADRVRAKAAAGQLRLGQPLHGQNSVVSSDQNPPGGFRRGEQGS